MVAQDLNTIVYDEWTESERTLTLVLILKQLARLGIVIVTEDERIVWSNGEDVRYA